MNRRRFLSYGAAALVGASVPRAIYANDTDSENSASGSAPQRRYDSYREMLKEAIQYRKIDTHNHINESNRRAELIDKTCQRVGITRTAVSIPSGDTPEEIRKNNNIVLAGMRKYPNRILGSCFVNPGYTRFALEEIDRCISQGMVMLGELYDDYKINDPVYQPIIEKCIELEIPLMMHGAAPLGNWREGYPTGNPLTTSTAEDFVDVANRYPEAMLIYGHLGGGGDWEYACEILQEAPSVYVETAGSVHDARMVDMAVEYLGVDRLLFSTDVNYETGIGKIMCASLTDAERKKIFFENFNNLLRRAGNHVD